MYMYNWFRLLYIWNQHNIVNQLYSSKSYQKKKKKRIAKVGTRRNWERKAGSYSEYRRMMVRNSSSVLYSEVIQNKLKSVLADTKVQDRQAGGSAKSGRYLSFCSQ